MTRYFVEAAPRPYGRVIPIGADGGNQTRAVATVTSPLLLMREAAPARRTKIWEFNTNLHCSIIGTCLSTGELRQVLKKLGVASPDSTDHELHGTAVGLASRHDKAAKLLNKALDERHRLAINRFAKATDEAGVRALWCEAVRGGEIPGAYWATLSHPAATHALVRDAFGEVHMLSHLVGAANRADIRRLCQLEADNAELLGQLERQQVALRYAVVARDATIQELREALAQRIVTEPHVADGNNIMLRQLVVDLERRLATEVRRGAVLGQRLIAAQTAVGEQRATRAQAEREAGALRRELEIVEASILAGCGDSKAIAPEPQLNGVRLLYVGGRPHHIARLRAMTERSGATFLHHDGGVEHHLNLLGGLISQAQFVVFPVDCISHHAAHAVKQQCRQVDKRFIPLRSASATSLLAALRRPDVAGLAEAAD